MSGPAQAALSWGSPPAPGSFCFSAPAPAPRLPPPPVAAHGPTATELYEAFVTLDADGEPVTTLGSPILSFNWSDPDVSGLALVEGSPPAAAGEVAMDVDSPGVEPAQPAHGAGG